jgi:hypothetical protein
VGDEAGETGRDFAQSFVACGYAPSAIALMVNVAHTRGLTVRGAAEHLSLPYSEVTIEQFEDPYQVPRVLRALVDAPRIPGSRQWGLVEKVMSTPLLALPHG